MGAFFTNVQVHVGARSPLEMHAAVVEALRRGLTADGEYAEAVDGAHADRVVLVMLPGDARWITVYDEHTESQQDAALDALAGMLAASIETHALAVVVHDSDALRLRLHGSQGLLAVHDSNPDNLSGTARKGPTLRSLEPWSGVLLTEDARAALLHALQGVHPFAEQKLDAVAQVLGLSAGACQRGFASLMRDSLPPECTRIALRRVRGGEPLRPPRLVFPSEPPPPCSFFEGEDLQLPLGALSEGGAGVGLSVAVWGDAVDAGLLDVTQVALHMHSHNDRQRLSASLEHATEEGRHARGVELASARIPANVLGGQLRPDDRHTLEAWSAAHLNVTVRGQARQAGEGTLHLCLIPSQNPDEGRARWSIPIRVDPAPRRPLLAVDAPMELLHAMEEPRTLFALFALGGTPDGCARAAIQAIESWNRVLCLRSAGTYVTELIPDGIFRPRTATLVAREMEHHRKWQELQEHLGNCALLTARLGTSHPPHEPHARDGDGFALGRALPLLMDGGGEPVAFLSLWMDTPAVPLDDVAAADAELRRIGDALAAQDALLQGCVGRWDYTPVVPAEPTPYELACGLGHAPVGTRAWASRWLRTVTDVLWLGPPLRRHLGNLEEIEKVMEVAAVGDGMRLQRRTGVSLDAAERALRQVLPGAG